MKRILWCLGAAMLLSSCATMGYQLRQLEQAATRLPEPTGPDSSLVIGGIAFDFPDGFFDLGPRTVVGNIKVGVTDQKENTKTWIYSNRDGYYYFLALPAHRYCIDELEWNGTVQSKRYTVTQSVNWVFEVSPATVAYIGDIVVVRRSPEKSGPTTARKTTYVYTRSTYRDFDPAGARGTITQLDPDSPWLKDKMLTTNVSGKFIQGSPDTQRGGRAAAGEATSPKRQVTYTNPLSNGRLHINAQADFYYGFGYHGTLGGGPSVLFLFPLRPSFGVGIGGYGAYMSDVFGYLFGPMAELMYMVPTKKFSLFAGFGPAFSGNWNSGLVRTGVVFGRTVAQVSFAPFRNDVPYGSTADPWTYILSIGIGHYF